MYQAVYFFILCKLLIYIFKGSYFILKLQYLNDDNFCESKNLKKRTIEVKCLIYRKTAFIFRLNYQGELNLSII